jgi:hypothetical protein
MGTIKKFKGDTPPTTKKRRMGYQWQLCLFGYAFW